MEEADDREAAKLGRAVASVAGQSIETTLQERDLSVTAPAD